MKKSLIALALLGLMTQSANASCPCTTGQACPCQIQNPCPTCVQCPTIPNPLQKVAIPRCPTCAPACPTCQPKSPCTTGSACDICPSCTSMQKFKLNNQFNGQYSNITGAAVPITAAPLSPACEAVTKANAHIEKVTIKGKYWYNRDRTGYRAVLSGNVCDQCTGCAAPIQAKGLILKPKKYFWEDDKYIVN